MYRKLHAYTRNVWKKASLKPTVSSIIYIYIYNYISNIYIYTHNYICYIYIYIYIYKREHQNIIRNLERVRFK